MMTSQSRTSCHKYHIEAFGKTFSRPTKPFMIILFLMLVMTSKSQQYRMFVALLSNKRMQNVQK